jgi:regulator of sigma E protease
LSNLGIIIAILGLGIIIFVHELGHFVAGKIMKLKIVEFMLGLPLGPKLIAIKRGETTYGVSSFLFGGYVRFAGALPLAKLKVEGVVPGSPGEGAGFKKGDLIKSINGKLVKDWSEVYHQFTDENKPTLKVTIERQGKELTLNLNPQRSFSGLEIMPVGNVFIEDYPHTLEAQSTWKRAIIVFAGPFMNVFMAFVIMAVASYIGLPSPTITIKKVMPKSPAQSVGIKPGDKIVEIDGNKIDSWDKVVKNISSRAGKTVTIKVKRGSQIISVKPKLRKHSSQGSLGIVSKLENKSESLIGSLKQGFAFTADATVVVYRLMGFIIATPVRVLHQLRSPIGIVQETAPIAQRSFIEYVITLAGMSVAIGIFNLIPIPPLDGGGLLISIIEGVIRRPLPKQALAAVNIIGALLLFLLMAYVIIGDIFRLALPGGG